MADASRATPRLIAAADQLRAQVADDMRRFRRNQTSFLEQVERARAVLAAYAELPVEQCAAAITDAVADLERAIEGETVRKEVEG